METKSRRFLKRAMAMLIAFTFLFTSVDVPAAAAAGSENSNVSAETLVSAEPEGSYEYSYLPGDQLTGYADSCFGNCTPADALDGDIDTRWHSNYAGSANTTSDPLVTVQNGMLVANNNYYIVLDEPQMVNSIGMYTNKSGGIVKSFKVYVSSEEYGREKAIDWGEPVGQTPEGGWPWGDPAIRTLEFDAVQEDVKSIRLEFTQTYNSEGNPGDRNIRGIDFYVSAGTFIPAEPVDPKPEDPEEEPLFTLGLLADIHIDGGIEAWDFPMREGATAIVNRMREEDDVDLMVVLGDTLGTNLAGSTWKDASAEYKKEKFAKAQEAVIQTAEAASESGRAAYLTGNHDFLLGGTEFNSGDWIDATERNLPKLVAAESTEDMEANAYFQKEFPAGTSADIRHVLAYHYEIDGLDFIMLNTPYAMNESIFTYDADSITWVKNKMAEIGRDKTVFLFTHYQLSTNKDSSLSANDDAEVQQRLKGLLDQYPRAIHIYGHTHDAGYIRSDTYERVSAYDAEGDIYEERTEYPTGFVSAYAGAPSYFGNTSGLSPQGGLTSATPNVVQSLLVYVYEDRVVFQMKNYGTANFLVETPQAYTVWRGGENEQEYAYRAVLEDLNRDRLICSGTQAEQLRSLLASYEALPEEYKAKVSPLRVQKLREQIELAEQIDDGSVTLQLNDKSQNGYHIADALEKTDRKDIRFAEDEKGRTGIQGWFPVNTGDAGEKLRDILGGNDNSFTFEATFRVGSDTHNCVCGKGDDAVALRINDNKTLLFYCSDGNGTWINCSTSDTYNTGDILHVAGVYDHTKGELRLYVGDKVWSRSGVSTIATNSRDLFLGLCEYDDSADNYRNDHTFYAFRLYDKALTQEEFLDDTRTAEDEHVQLWYDFSDSPYEGIDRTAEDILVDPETVTIEEGTECSILAQFSPYYAAGSLTYTSSRPDVAEAAADGTVTGKAPGTAVITVASPENEGLVKTVTVKVTERLNGADYTKVEAAIAEAEKLVKEEYVDFTAVQNALDAVVEGLDITKQAEVDAMAQAILDAIAQLIRKPDM